MGGTRCYVPVLARFLCLKTGTEAAAKKWRGLIGASLSEPQSWSTGARASTDRPGDQPTVRGGRTASREFIFAESAAHLPYKFAYKICRGARESSFGIEFVCTDGVASSDSEPMAP